MKPIIKQTLEQLNSFAREKGVNAEFYIHAEKDALTRFANSAVSLNTAEDIITLSITAHRDNRRGTYTLVTNPDRLDDMKQAIITADEIARHSEPLHYNVTFTPLPAHDDDDSHFDEALSAMTSREKLDYVNEAVTGLENNEIQLSGMFSSGTVWKGTANTLSDEILFHATTDARVALELCHAGEKWELAAGQSAGRKSDLDAQALRDEFSVLLGQYKTGAPMQLPLGKYDVVFGKEASAELLNFLTWIGFDGGSCKRKLTFLKEKHLGEKTFSDNFSLTDDPTARETFPYSFDSNGLPRRPFPIVERGVFKAFIWDRDSADEFGEKETGHSMPAMSLVAGTGDSSVNSLTDLLNMPREKDILFVPHLHYMNVVNETEGIITGCSRFGALILRKDGRVDIPYNVRVKDSLFNLFGNIDWLSSELIAVNTSNTYGRRNPTAVLVPRFIKVNNVDITRANAAF